MFPYFPLKGLLLSPGRSCHGRVVNAYTPQRPDGIYVAKTLSFADYEHVVASQAVICENGGKTSHLAIICRILGKPVILVHRAMDLLSSGQVITVNGANGVVHLGHALLPVDPPAAGDDLLRQRLLSDAIGIQLSIVDAENIRRINRWKTARVNQYFLREEFIWVRANQNPFMFLERHGRDQVRDFIASELETCATEMMTDQLLNYRVLDLRSDEVVHFGGVGEVPEANPELGSHGIRQLLQMPELLIAQLQAVDKLYGNGMTNIILTLPFINELSEYQQVRQLICDYCQNEIKVGVFVETPSAVVELPYMIAAGVTAVYIGTKDLTQMVLACDRSNIATNHIFDSKKRAVQAFLQRILNDCHAHQIQAYCFSLYQDLNYFLRNLKHLSNISICSYEFERLLTIVS